MKLTTQELYKKGAHFGHKTKRWNPKMDPYIYGKLNGIHLIDLSKTLAKINDACQKINQYALDGKKILFVGTKRQAQVTLKEVSEKIQCYYVTHRWLGGILTNLPVIKKRVEKYNEFVEMRDSGVFEGLKKKEVARYNRNIAKMERDLSGIKTMQNIPDLLVIVDINRESIALKEAKKLGIPVIAFVDTNCNPEDVDLAIPINDDSTRATSLVINLFGEVFQKSFEVFEENRHEQERKESEERARVITQKRKQMKQQKSTAKKDEATEDKVESSEKKEAGIEEKKSTTEEKVESKAPIKKAETKVAAKKAPAKKAETKVAAKKAPAKKAETKVAAKKDEIK